MNSVNLQFFSFFKFNQSLFHLIIKPADNIKFSRPDKHFYFPPNIGKANLFHRACHLSLSESYHTAHQTNASDKVHDCCKIVKAKS